MNKNDRTVITEKTVIEHSVSLSYGDLFEKMTDYHESFINKLRQYVEQELFSAWSSCGRIGEIIAYKDVKSKLFNKCKKLNAYDVVYVNYYNGTVKINNRIYILNISLSVLPGENAHGSGV